MCKLTEDAGNDRIGCQRTNRQRQEHEKRERSSHDVSFGGTSTAARAQRAAGRLGPGARRLPYASLSAATVNQTRTSGAVAYTVPWNLPFTISHADHP